MDAAATGALIGIGVMVCLGGMVVINDKGAACLKKIKARWSTYKQQRQPLLPVTSQNPLLVRTNSKRFQMKELVAPK